ncbi:MAG: glycine cleavage system protein GcvH [Deltaproteobacteria bacterium]|nr:glycine cleavage system protein GcvH [Deltaproteobacteria bacterium]
MNVPEHLRYTAEHEWVRMEGDEAVIGVTEFAAEQLGDVVFVELPAVNSQVTAGKAFGVIESVKAVSDLYAPLSGKVTAVNSSLTGAPESVNADPYKAWMIRVAPLDTAGLDKLLTAGQYRALITQ